MNKAVKEPMIQRVHVMAMWLEGTLQNWIVTYQPDTLDVLIETPIMNRDERGVVTIMTQMRLIAAYEEACYRLKGCVVSLGEVHNQTAKLVFTGTGKATKDIMVLHSAWSKRPDVSPREHLADAQGISMVRPVMVLMDDTRIALKAPLYEDNAIGVGPEWKGKL